MTELIGRVNPDEKIARVFACSCGAERTAAWDALLDAVLAELQIRPERLGTAIVFGLESNFSASIVGIISDQWARIITSTQDGVFRTEVDCDLIEHGLAATWRLFKERFPEGYIPPPEPEEGVYVCPDHMKTDGYESCCACGGWAEDDPDKGRLCTEMTDLL